MNWYLRFRTHGSPTLEAVEHALGTSIGAAAQRTFLEWEGNPRDGYDRQIESVIARADGCVTYTLKLVQQALDTGDPPPPDVRSLSIRLCAPDHSAVETLADWASLREALASLGYEDTTLAGWPAPIVDALESEGQHALAAKMRSDITAALVREIPHIRHVALSSTRPDDINAVLRAVVRPEDIVSLSIGDCELTELPEALSLFPGLTNLALNEARIGPSALRRLSFPCVTWLSLNNSCATRIEPEDFRGFPAVSALFVCDTPVEYVSSALTRAMPSLGLIVLKGTPFSRDRARVEALRRDWPGVRVET